MKTLQYNDDEVMLTMHVQESLSKTFPWEDKLKEMEAGASRLLAPGGWKGDWRLLGIKQDGVRVHKGAYTHRYTT